MESIGNIIKKYRKNNNLTMKELAQRVDVSQATISLLENGKREVSADLLEKIVTTLNIPSDVINEHTFIINDEDAEYYLNNKAKTLKMIGFSSPYMKVNIEINTEPNEKLLEIEDEGYRNFLTTFHNRAVKKALTEFFDKHKDVIVDYVSRSYEKETKLLMDTANKEIEIENEPKQNN